MGAILKDRRTSRWPSSIVPFQVDEHVSQIGRLQINAAMKEWSRSTPIRFTERTDQPDFISFNIRNDECFSSIGRTGGNQVIGCDLPILPVVVPGSQLAFEQQMGDQVDCLFVGTDGAVYVMWTVASTIWSNPVALTPPNTAPPGAPVALKHQNGPNQLDAVFVDNNGSVNVMWVIENGVWQGPVALTPPNAAPRGAPVALEHQGGDTQLDALFVDTNGALNVMWVVGGEAWQGPVAITSPNAVLPGTRVALEHQGDSNQLDAVFMSSSGTVDVMWVIGGDPWQGPAALTQPNNMLAGAPVTLHHQGGNNQLDALYIDNNGAVNVMWVIGGDRWQGPVSITSPGVALPRSPVALEYQGGSNQLDAMFVDGNGAINVMWVIDGGIWQGPVPLTPPFTTAAGSPVSIAVHPGDLLEAFVVSASNVPSTISAKGLQPWSSVLQIGSGFGTPAVIHEIGHALGLFHEQQRPDRNLFLRYISGNVLPGMEEANFKIPDNVQPLGPYDYGSIMHYGRGAFSAPGMGPTLIPPDGVTIGIAAVPDAEDIQTIRYLYSIVTDPKASLNASYQGSDQQLTVAFTDTFGGVSVMWVIGSGVWDPSVQISLPAVPAPPGSPVALEHQGGANQLDALFVDGNGAVNVMWVIGDGVWQGPVALTAPNAAPAGAAVTLHHQGGPNQLDALYIDNNGAVNVMWVIGDGVWEGPVPISSPNTALPGTPVALHHQGGDNQLDALFIDTNGALNVMWVVGGEAWQGPVAITPGEAAMTHSPVALEYQGGANQLDALFVGRDGAVKVMWVVDGGVWQGPATLTDPNTVPPGSQLSLEHQDGEDQLDAVFVDSRGAVNVMWVNNGGAWQGPAVLTAPNIALPGSPVALHHQAGISQLDALFADTNGVVNVMWVNGGGDWQGPVVIS